MQRWSRARRKTERLIDFDGSSAAPRTERRYLFLPAYFLPASSSVLRLFVCPSVVDETFTRHKRPAPQICPPPVVVSDNSSFLFVLLLSPLPLCFRNFFVFICLAAKKCKGRKFKALPSVKQRSYGNCLCNFVVLTVSHENEDCQSIDTLERNESHHRVNVTQHIIKRDDENEFFSAPERRKGRRELSVEVDA